MVASGRDSTTILMQLCRNPQRFDFFQAVRLLEMAASGFCSDDESLIRRPVGYSFKANQEAIRFYGLTSLCFPCRSIYKVALYKDVDNIKNTRYVCLRFNMVVTFIGLAGTNGVLSAYDENKLRKSFCLKDKCLNALFDIFNHRIISFFYRAWKKYRIIANYEQISFVLACFAGLDDINIPNNFSSLHKSLIYYSGLFHQPRSASVLQAILKDYFLCPVCIKQFQVETFFLTKEQHSRITVLKDGEFYNRLGSDTMLGNKIHDMQGKFRICIGPIGYKNYLKLLPGGEMLKPLCELTRLYVGTGLNFDLQLLLLAQDVPTCQLVENNYLRLGCNIWLGPIFKNASIVINVDNKNLFGSAF